MRIAFLCKRRYMSKDVILDRYARLYEIPYQLARLGHEVRGYCLSYHGEDEGEWQHEAEPGSLLWKSRSLGRLRLPVLLGYPQRILGCLRASKPDVVIGASDIPHVVLGAWLSRRLGVPYVADLYDNFEGFGQARIPGMVWALRRAVRGADLVLTTSEPLRELVMNAYRAGGEVLAMPSSVDTAVFHVRDKRTARDALGLPSSARLIGTAGGLYREKGIEVLYAAWPQLADRFPDLHLVLAGPVEQGVPRPEGERVHYLGALPHDRVALLFSALDVGVMCIRDTPFGRYCFPQKAYEMLACGLPVVVADLGAMRALLATTPHSLYEVGNAGDLADKLGAQLENPARADVRVDDWRTLLAAVEPRLVELALRRR